MTAQMVKPHNDEKLGSVLSALERASGPLDYYAAKEVLSNSVGFHPDVHWSDGKRLVTQALAATDPKKTGRSRSTAALTDALRVAERAHLGSQPRPYVLATDLMIKPPPGLNFRRMSAARFWFGASHSPKYPRSEEFAIQAAAGYFPADLPPGSTAVRISVRARSERAAGFCALEALDLLLGVWNLLYGPGRLGFGDWIPLSSVRVGPFHTLHEPGGKRLQAHWWYQPNFKPPPRLPDLSEHWRRFSKAEGSIRRALTRRRDRAQLEEALRAYASALDAPDPESAFIKLWSVLESLTSGGARLSQDDIQRRTVFLSPSNDEFWGRELEFLRDRRNRLAHRLSSDDSVDPTISLQQLRAWVNALLRYHLFEAPRRCSFLEAAQLLHMPRDMKTLRRRRADYEWALSVRASRQ